MAKFVTIQEFVNSKLDSAYNAAAKKMFAGIAAVSTAPASEMQISIADLQQEAQGLTENEQPISKDNKFLQNALVAFGAVMLTTADLIDRDSPSIEETGQAIGVNAVTSKVFSRLSNSLRVAIMDV